LSDRLRILFTEGASLSARQTLYPLGPRHEIDLVDPDPFCQCRFSTYVRRYFPSPSFSRQPARFLRFLLRMVRGGRYDVLLPTHEQVYVLSRFRDSFTRHIGLALPDFAALQRLQNKADFSRLLTELQLPQPETLIFRTRAELDRTWQYPFFLKLAHSTAGSGVFFVENQRELQHRAETLARNGLFDGRNEVLVQQPARGVLSTAQAVFDRGRLVGVHCFEARRLGVGGMSTARISADHPIVRQHVERIGGALGWHGAFFIDYFFDRRAAAPEYIEANPRIGETVNAMSSGLNLPELLAQVSIGKSPPRAPLGRFGVLTHNILMILMSAAYEGQSRSALLRELYPYCTRDSLYRGGEDEITRPRDDPLSFLPFCGMTLGLLAWPKLAKHTVTATVQNYSLPAATTEQIKALPLELLDSSS
jgi:hypothetical protein